MHENFRIWPYTRKKENMFFLLFFRLCLAKNPFFLVIKLPKIGLRGVFQTHP
jgi:hypothetical protein